MKIFALVPAVLVAGVLLVSATASAAPGNVGFGFNARDISGFPTGSATLTGGGAYDPVSGFVHSAGGFRCTSDVRQGPLTGVSRAKAFAGTRSISGGAPASSAPARRGSP
jgi:hypothetical protein